MSMINNNTDRRLLIYPSVGDLIVARPMLGDATFSRSVCMMMDVDSAGEDTGCMGLILNKKLEDVSLYDIFTDLPEAKDIPLYLGGPVECDRLFVLHTLGNRFGKSIEIIPGIHIGGDVQLIRDYIASGGETEGRIRFFIGYSGWEKNQLRDELSSGFWEVTRPESAGTILHGSGMEYWQNVVKRMGQDYRRWLIVPENPELN